MKDYCLSFETCKQLKEWKCKIEGYSMTVDFGYKKEYYITYDIRDIICNKEMAKAFFGINSYKNNGDVENYNVFFKHTSALKDLMLTNNQEKAEKYLLKHCVFNETNNI